MDIQSLRILMDINALQSFGSVRNMATMSEGNSPLFSTMLGEFMTQSNASLQQGTIPNSLLYNGMNDVFLPSSLKNIEFNLPNQAIHHKINENASNNQYADIINSAARKFNIPEKLIASVIKHESNFNNHTVSRAGAQGLMQLMPGTAKFLGVRDSFNPSENIHGGARYLRQMLDQFGGDMKLALAAYNAGPGNVKKYGGIPPFKETQNYVKKVLNTFHN